jgi:hypothetical protein
MEAAKEAAVAEEEAATAEEATTREAPNRIAASLMSSPMWRGLWLGLPRARGGEGGGGRNQRVWNRRSGSVWLLRLL